MTLLFKKLNLRDEKIIHVLRAPASFEQELAALEASSGIDIKRAAKGRVSFALAFAITLAELDQVSAALVAAAEGDATLWIAYPKASSKKYRCEFTRDIKWPVLGAADYEPVRQVAIDEDWSALRFRKVTYIQTMRRVANGAISRAGRAKAQSQHD